MELNDFGAIIQFEWLRTALLRSNVELDEFIIMPNHFHGIISILNDDGRGTARRAPTSEQFGCPISRSLPTIIRLFKSASTKRINELRNTLAVLVWQRGYYEHIIRNENELNQVRQYVLDNPVKWDEDSENTDNH